MKRGDDPFIRATREDEVLLYSAGQAWNPELEDTNMFQTDSRDRAADRDADAYDDMRYSRTNEQVVAEDKPAPAAAPAFDKADDGTEGGGIEEDPASLTVVEVAVDAVPFAGAMRLGL